MNKKILQKHIKNYQEGKEANPEQFQEDWSKRQEHIAKYQGYDVQKILSMDAEDVYEYISPLWAMQIWGNKRYVTDNHNGLEFFKKELIELLWFDKSIEERWDRFRKNKKAAAGSSSFSRKITLHDYRFTIY